MAVEEFNKSCLASPHRPEPVQHLIGDVVLLAAGRDVYEAIVVHLVSGIRQNSSEQEVST